MNYCRTASQGKDYRVVMWHGTAGAVVSDAIDAHLDWDNPRRPGREVQRVNVDFPVDLLRAIDREARRIGVTRQAFIKLRLADMVARSR